MTADLCNENSRVYRLLSVTREMRFVFFKEYAISYKSYYSVYHITSLCNYVSIHLLLSLNKR